MLATAEIKLRRPVWLALSELCCPKRLKEQEVDYILDILLESGYSINELDAIYRYEVAPAIYSTACSDKSRGDREVEEYNLCQQAYSRANKRSSSLYRLSCQLRAPLLYYSSLYYWQRMKKRMLRFV